MITIIIYHTTGNEWGGGGDERYGIRHEKRNKKR
jgi:hypothetical protein